MTATKTAASASGQAANPPASREDDRPAVLLVDDQPARLLTYESILAGLEVHCVKAHSGSEALKRLLEQEFAAVLLDVSMPGMDGFEVAGAIRQHPRLEHTPIIFVTGVHVTEIDRLKGYDIGALDYIAVPVVPEILRSKVAVLAELHRRRSELLALNRELSQARALRGEAERFRLITETIPQLVWSARPDGFSDYYNGRFLDYLGLTLEEMQGYTWLAALHPEDVAATERIWKEAVATGIEYSTEFRIRCGREGPYRWHAVRGVPLRDAAGRILRWFGTCTDIDDRKRSEEALREQEQRLLLANRAARLGTHDWRIVEGTIAWDERTSELWGVEPGEPVTYDIFLAGIHPDDRAATERAVGHALDPAGDGQYFATFRVRSRQDGETRWVEAHGQALFENGQPSRLVGTVQDITDRKLAADRLRESEERFRELANHIDQFAWTCDELCQVTWYNQRWYDYTGTTPEQMRGLGWMKVHHPQHLPRVMASIRQSAASGEPWEDTFPLLGRDGQYRWFLSRAVPIRSSDGRILRWFGTNTDVTQLRRLQEALESTDRRKDEFLAMLGHELRNPVAPITSAAEALARMQAADEKTRYCADVILRQASHLSRLLDDLLDVASITRRRVVLHRETLPLMSSVEQAIETTQPLMREKKQHLVRVAPAAALYVNGDRIRLAQCVSNVLMNAAKYSGEGGEIRLTVSSDASQAIIEVSDTGVGIPAELLPRVFDLFVQSERPLDRASGGLGIGLAVCRELVELHGGTVSAASPGPGRGATFTLRLPLAPGPAGDAGTGAQTCRAAGSRVLIVDDNRDAADTVALLLDAAGHETLAVYTAADALGRITAFKPHAVILDIGLPGIDGYEVAKRMKAMLPPVRLIALSGYGQPEDRRRSSAAGFDAHLVKPVEVEGLMKVLRAGA